MRAHDRDEPGTNVPGEMDPAFDKAFEGLRATGASVEIRQLVELLARHGREEGRLLSHYEELADTTPDKAARYLIGLVLDDERRHHRLLAEMATGMAWDTLGDAPGSTPQMGLHLDEHLAEPTRELREAEEDDRRELQALRKRLRPFADTTLWGLLVDIMLLDTEKHATILRFLERHASK